MAVLLNIVIIVKDEQNIFIRNTVRRLDIFRIDKYVFMILDIIDNEREISMLQPRIA